MNIVLAAGGTGGHIFPAVSVALELKKQCADLSLLWIGTSRSRERELGGQHDIPVKVLDVRGIRRSLSPSNVKAIVEFFHAVNEMNGLFKQNRPDAVIAFGGYVCAPVLATARLQGIPYFLQEQNTVPGVVNRFFASGARQSFLGFPLSGRHSLRGATLVTGTPVRTVSGTFDHFTYAEGFDRRRRCVLICGGSQGAASMNECLIGPVERILEKGMQVVWQTGETTCGKIQEHFKAAKGIVIFDSVNDLYPYYAVAEIVICRSGASTLNEIAYFGRPCIMIPLPWSAENHQWMNAGYVENCGWGVRIEQNERCAALVTEVAERILSDRELYESMSRKALDSASDRASAVIAQQVLERISC